MCFAAIYLLPELTRRRCSWQVTRSAAVKQCIVKSVNKWWKTSPAKISSVSTRLYIQWKLSWPIIFSIANSLCFEAAVSLASSSMFTSSLPRLLFNSGKTTACNSPPCGLIKLLLWLLSMSLIRPLTWTSETVPVYGYSVKGSVVRAGSRGADREGDDIQARWELGWWAM